MNRLKMSRQKMINKHAAKIVSCLIKQGFYPPKDFNIQRDSEYCEIDLREMLPSLYTTLKVYEDGIFHLLDEKGKIQFEAKAISEKVIIKTILR